MKKIFSLLALCLLLPNLAIAEINAKDIPLTAEQNQKLTELKNRLKAEIEPIWEEIESSKTRIAEIEKHYFEEFWNMLSDEQKQKFSELNK